LKNLLTDTIQVGFVGVYLLVVALLPSTLVFYQAYKFYCTATNERFVPEWCVKGVTALYPHIQKYYWDVGFLKYWNMGHLYQISMGMATLLIMALGIATFIKSNRLHFLTLNLFRDEPKKKDKPDSSIDQREEELGVSNINLCPIVWMTLAMLIINFFLAHVMVSTRINSFNPFIYWFIIEYMANPCEEERRLVENCLRKQKNNGLSLYIFSLRHHWLKLYILFYLISGVLHFCNFDLWV
jgi:Gpi18-like mannosyltransferase